MARRGGAGGFLSLAIALAVVNVLLLAPHWLFDGEAAGVRIALEAVLAAAVFAVLPGTRWRAPLAGAVAAAAVLASALAFADAVARYSLGRPLNLYLDLQLAGAVYRLTTGAFGMSLTALLLAGCALTAVLAAWLVAALLSSAAGARWKRLAAAGIAAAAVTGATLPGDAFRDAATPDAAPPQSGRRAAWPAARLVADQARHFGRMLREREAFAAELAAAPAGYADLPGLLRRLRGRDVLLAFVESYGVSALDDPRYAPVVRPRLDDLAARAADAGVHLATGLLTAPTQGGQSWFSHLSLLSGLWVDNQLRYDLLLASGRETLIDDFRRAGHRTAALMPANTLAWPEGERLGYDEILARSDIAYAGPAFNWVTMPDQFTWSFLQRRVRAPGGGARPVFAEIGLISSHAPWTPILPVLDDWDAIGDGAIFKRWRGAGERPEDLWRDRGRVREHFARAIGYAIDVVAGYAERYVDDRTLLIVLGDHQPAPLVTGEDASRATPAHVMSGDPALIEPFLRRGYAAGVLPDPAQAAAGMDTFRDWFVRAFSAPAGAAGTAEAE